MSDNAILKVAVPSPLFTTFDYRCPSPDEVRPGIRVRVPFGRTRVVGVVVAVANRSEIHPGRLKPIEAILDSEPLWSSAEWELLLWASRYYQHPIGEVLATALPGLLRQGRPAAVGLECRWRLTGAGRAAPREAMRRAPRQAAIVDYLEDCPEGCRAEALQAVGGAWRSALRALLSKGWVESFEHDSQETPITPTGEAPRLNTAQQSALGAIRLSLGRYQTHLLAGVTGSGKTEIYLRLIEEVVRMGRQTLVLVPEIGLTPQLVERFRHRLGVRLAVLHSGLGDRERLDAWVAARTGRAAAVIGTRSAVFVPVCNLGLVVVDEEHDPSFKQQEGFRYHARDLAVLRARHAGVPAVLGSATPSLESLHNVKQGRYLGVSLPERAGEAQHPALGVLDLRRQVLEEGMAPPLLRAVEETLAAGDQVLLFLNRRGYSPALVCHDCGWVAECRRCDAPLTLHRGRNRLCCHHCGAERAIDSRCEECRSGDLRPAGRGTERIEEALQHRYPGVPVIRIDRDTTRRRGAMEAQLGRVRDGAPCLLVGTQMLAKGHHLPDVTLVGMLNVDHGLYSSDFRAPERMAQLIVQVAGRAGRANKPGRVLIQTHHPDHPLLQRLLREGYDAFAREALRERREAGFPPYSALALVRAEATNAESPRRFLQTVAERFASPPPGSVQIWGPVPAPMERRAGRYRAQLLLQGSDRAALQSVLARVVPDLGRLPGARRVRWSVDVDPQEMM